MRSRLCPAIVAVVILFAVHCSGQSAEVTSAALLRTFLIQTNLERGTAFSIDVDKREYWITAKHLFTGVESGPAGTFDRKTVFAALLAQSGEGPDGNNQHWINERFTVIDPGKDIDILVLVPDHLLIPAGGSLKADTDGVNLGGDCEFLGFAYGGGWKAQIKNAGWAWLPYVKHCTVSGQLRAAVLGQKALIWILDGINNKGFSGGPVLYETGPKQEVFAVISGYYQEPLKVISDRSSTPKTTGVPPPPQLPGASDRVGPKQEAEIVEANSGFIIAFDLQPAIDAIRKNPIGPLLKAH